MKNANHHRLRWWAVASAAAALLSGAPAYALTEAECFWDVGAQASTNELAGIVANPAGQWSYLWQAGSSGAPSEYAAGTPTLYTAAEHTNDWYSQSNAYLRGFVHNVGDNVPMVVSNTSPDPAGQNTV